jgi:hypothetical protein
MSYGADRLSESSEHYDLFLKFVTDRQLDGKDIDAWPEADQNEFFALSDEITAKYRRAEEERLALPLDEQHPEAFYIINITLDTVDGPEYQTVDIRKLPLEKLSKLCSTFPQYNDYYFKKVLELGQEGR